MYFWQSLLAVIFKNFHYSNLVMVLQVLFPPCGSYNGSELTKEMFRWDQRLYTILLKIPGIMSTTDTANTEDPDPVYDHFSSLCEYSGGNQWGGAERGGVC